MGKDLADEYGFIVSQEDKIKHEVTAVASSNLASWTSEREGMENRFNLPHVRDHYERQAERIIQDAKREAEIYVGRARLSMRMKRAGRYENQMFVIMRIGDPDLDKIYDQVYGKISEELGFGKAIRIDQDTAGEAMVKEIPEYLRKCKIIVADLTESRPNCYFEVGYCFGLDKEKNVILCANHRLNQNDPGYDKDKDKLHFDLSTHKVIFWHEGKLDEFADELKTEIKKRLDFLDNAQEAKGNGIE